MRPRCRESKAIGLDVGRRLIPVVGSLSVVLGIGLGLVLVLSQSVGAHQLGSAGFGRPFWPAAGATSSELGRENY